MISIIVSFIVPNFFFIPFLLTFPISCCSSRINNQENQVENEPINTENFDKIKDNKNKKSQKLSQSPNKCTICGMEIEQSNLRYCPECGAKLYIN
jgi:predicted Zn-ribbon and HTH transcriptional regulator